MPDENITPTTIPQEAPAKHPGGRPTVFREQFVEQAYKLTLLGATDKELADFFGVCEDTINNWKHDVPEFFESIKKGKAYADAEVADKLYQRAKGYEHPAEKVFCYEGEIIRAEIIEHYPPDTGAAMAWLKNRQPEKWRDSHDVTTGGKPLQPSVVNFSQIVQEQTPIQQQENKA